MERPRHKDLLPWMRDFQVDKETGLLLLKNGVTLRMLSTLGEEDLVRFGVVSLSKRLRLYYDIWLCSGWLPRPGDAFDDEPVPISFAAKSRSAPVAAPPLLPQPTPPAATVAAEAAPEGDPPVVPQHAEPTSEQPAVELVVMTNIARGLLQGYQVKKWYREEATDRRRLVHELAEMVRGVDQRMARFREAVIDGANKKVLSERDVQTMFGPLLALHRVWVELSSSVRKCCTHWTRASCFGDAMMFAVSLEWWYASMMQYLTARGQCIYNVDAAARASAKLQSHISHCEELLNGKVTQILAEALTPHIGDMMKAIERVRMVTHFDHPDFRKLGTLLSRLRALQDADERIRR
jgi:hypothetical protein